MRSSLLTTLLAIFSASAFATAGNCETNFTYTLGEGGSVEFDNQSFWDNDEVEWTWYFGDAGASEMSNPSFTFEPGTYNVCLVLSTMNCEDEYCEEIVIPEPCTGLEITLESIIDPATIIEIAWLLETIEGIDIDEGAIEIVLGGATGEISLCIPDGCYSMTLTGPEDFSFDIIILLMELAELPIDPVSIALDDSTLVVEFAINSDCKNEVECPDQLWSGPTETCGCYAFEVGSAADSPQVSWYFGEDGPYFEGHFADYCWEENGTYTVTAVYSSETCPQETYTTEVVVDCFGNDCELDVEYEQNDCGQGVYEVVEAPENASIWWTINGDWLAESSDVLEVNLEPGEYTICAFYETPDCPMGSEWCVEFFIDNCTEPCNINVEIISSDDCTNAFVMEAYDYPEGASLVWTINGDVVDDDNYLSWDAPEFGEYQICVAYETPDCPNGAFWCETFFYENCDPCPQEIWMSEGNNCGCYEFEIGSFVEGESVTWDFGNGVTIEGGHYIEYCYEEDGEYIITAWYESSECEGMLYTLGEAIVNCYDDCTEVIGFIDSAADGPEWIEWTINDIDSQESVEDGICQLSTSDCAPTICLPDGCYEFIIQSETVINAGINFEAFIYSLSEEFEIISEIISDYSVVWEFAIGDGCEATDCALEIDLIEAECGWVYLEASDFPAGTTLWWEIDDAVVQQGGDGFDWEFEEEGWHNVCVFYETPECPQGVWACEEIFVVFCTDCPTDIWAGELDDCGCFEFEIGSFQEGESVDWTWGDGTEDFGAGHYIQHCYEEPGLYIVEVNFVSDICPDGVIAVYTIEVVCDDCSDVSFAFDSFADLGGSEYIEWALTNPGGEVVEEGGCEYVNGPYCDAVLCLEDGCYEMDIWFPTPITSDDAFFSAAFIAGEQLPYGGNIVWIDDMHMTYFFGVNSDCGNAIEDVIQSQFEIYPVPASDVLTLNVSHDLVGARVIIYDAQGRSVIDAPMTGINKELSVNSLAQGLYTTVIQNDTVRIARKIQILR